MTRIFKILLPSEEIAEGSTVIKKTGEYDYILKKKVSLKVDGKPVEFKSADKGAFLYNPRTGDYYTVSAETELIVKMTAQELISFAEGILEEEEAK